MSDFNENSQEIIDLVVENKDKSDDDLLSLIVGAGVPFKKARKVLESILVSQGLRMNAAEVTEKAAEMLASFSVTADTTAEEVQEQIENLMDELGITIQKARNLVKAEFTGEDIPYPKAVKAPSAPRTSTPGFNGDAALVSDYLIENKDCTREEFANFMEEKGKATTKTGADKVGRWWNVLVDLKVFAEKYCA